MIIDEDGYIARRTCGIKSMTKHRTSEIRKQYRNWWLVKCTANGSPVVEGGRFMVILSRKEFAGKRVRFKMEVLDD